MQLSAALLTRLTSVHAHGAYDPGDDGVACTPDGDGGWLDAAEVEDLLAEPVHVAKTSTDVDGNITADLVVRVGERWVDCAAMLEGEHTWIDGRLFSAVRYIDPDDLLDQIRAAVLAARESVR